jgi:hypothetical protein
MSVSFAFSESVEEYSGRNVASALSFSQLRRDPEGIGGLQGRIALTITGARGLPSPEMKSKTNIDSGLSNPQAKVLIAGESKSNS